MENNTHAGPEGNPSANPKKPLNMNVIELDLDDMAGCVKEFVSFIDTFDRNGVRSMSGHVLEAHRMAMGGLAAVSDKHGVDDDVQSIFAGIKLLTAMALSLRDSLLARMTQPPSGSEVKDIADETAPYVASECGKWDVMYG